MLLLSTEIEIKWHIPFFHACLLDKQYVAVPGVAASSSGSDGVGAGRHRSKSGGSLLVLTQPGKIMMITGSKGKAKQILELAKKYLSFVLVNPKRDM